MSYATPSSHPLAGSTPSNAVQQLMQQHGGMLFGLCRRFCSNEDEAADLVQETMLEAYKSWPSFRGDAKATTWLYRIAARICQRMHHKKGPGAGELPSDDIIVLNHTPIRVRVCRAVFHSIDFTKDLCTSTTHHPLPEDISERIIVKINLSEDS